MKLKGRTAVVTGATSGFGEATALLFAREGASVIAHGRNADRGSALVDRLRRLDVEAHFVRGDVGDPADATALAEVARAEFGHLDVLVLNAGIADIGFGPFWEVPVEDFDRLSATNVRGIASQNRCRCSRHATGGRPGDRIAGLPVAAAPLSCSSYPNTSSSKCCDDQLNLPSPHTDESGRYSFQLPAIGRYVFAAYDPRTGSAQVHKASLGIESAVVDIDLLCQPARRLVREGVEPSGRA